jgi:hypothetical protein
LVRFGQPESVQAVGSMKSTTYAVTTENIHLLWSWHMFLWITSGSFATTIGIALFDI